MVCFLRITLLQTTDVVLALAERLIQELYAHAAQDVRDAERRHAQLFRHALRAISRVLSNPAIPDGALRQEILGLMPSATNFSRVVLRPYDGS